MIHCLIYLHFQHKFSWQTLLVVYNIVLQLLVSGFLTAIFFFLLPLNHDELYYFCPNDDETKGMNG